MDSIEDSSMIIKPAKDKNELREFFTYLCKTDDSVKNQKHKDLMKIWNSKRVKQENINYYLDILPREIYESECF